MKKRFVVSLIALLAVTLTGWTVFGTKESMPIELAAFNSLTNEEISSLIIISPKDSQTEKVTVTNRIKPFISENYDKNNVYQVTFNNTATKSHGNLLVFVDTDKTTVVGKGFDEKTVSAPN